MTTQTLPGQLGATVPALAAGATATSDDYVPRAGTKEITGWVVCDREHERSAFWVDGAGDTHALFDSTTQPVVVAASNASPAYAEPFRIQHHVPVIRFTCKNTHASATASVKFFVQDDGV